MNPALKLPSLLVLAILGVCAFGAAAQRPENGDVNSPPAPGGTTPGRFLLIAATVHANGPEQGPMPMLFRIDTATGVVWKYSSIPFPVKDPTKEIKTITTEGWVQVNEDLLASVRLSKKAAEEIQKRR